MTTTRRNALLALGLALAFSLPVRQGTASAGTAAAALTADPLIYTARDTIWRETLAGTPAPLLPPGSGVLSSGDAAPMLAPDGHHLLYGTRRAGDRSGSWTDLWLLDALGGRPVHLVSLPGGASGSAFAWSADSGGVVYVDFNEHLPRGYRGVPVYSWALSTLDLTLPGARPPAVPVLPRPRLVARAAGHYRYFPRPLGWSRAARRLYLLEEQDGGATAYDVLSEQGAVLQRYAATGAVLWATLSPNQGRVLIVATPVTAQIRPSLTVRAAARPAEPLLALQPPAGWIFASRDVWAPDGHAFAFGSTPPSSGDAAASQIRIAALAGGKTRLVYQARGIDAVAWSPDGRALLLWQAGEAAPAGHERFLALRPDGTGVQTFTSDGVAGLSSVQQLVGWGIAAAPRATDQ